MFRRVLRKGRIAQQRPRRSRPRFQLLSCHRPRASVRFPQLPRVLLPRKTRNHSRECISTLQLPRVSSRLLGWQPETGFSHCYWGWYASLPRTQPGKREGSDNLPEGVYILSGRADVPVLLTKNRSNSVGSGAGGRPYIDFANHRA